MLLTHAFALSASQFVHKKSSQRIYTGMHSGGPELTKLTYSRHEDNLLRHRGDRHLNGNISTIYALLSISKANYIPVQSGVGLYVAS